MAMDDSWYNEDGSVKPCYGCIGGVGAKVCCGAFCSDFFEEAMEERGTCFWHDKPDCELCDDAS